MTAPSPAADDDLDEVRRDLDAGFLTPVRDGVVVCWCCGGRMTGSPARLPIPCTTCRHCGATIWFWPNSDDASVAQSAPSDRPLDRTQGPVTSGGDRAPTTARAVAGEDEAERDEAGGRGHGGILRDDRRRELDESD